MVSMFSTATGNGGRGARRARGAGAACVALAALCSRLAPGAFAQDTVATDRAALEAIYDATGGPGWTDSTNWRSDAPLSEWFGVYTAGDGRVTGLFLPGNGLSGPIPAELGWMSRLRELHLGVRWDDQGATLKNGLTGRIPDALGDLAELELLSLGSNELSGEVPSSLGDLSNLRWLSLDWNDLSGPLPSSFGDLSNLRVLRLEGNALSGPVPSSLGRLSNLEELDLQSNWLSGPLPSSFGNLSNLRRLSLGGNALIGPIPATLGGLSALEALELHSNTLDGPLPATLGNLSGLETLELYSNALSGPIPSSLGNLRNLRILGLGGNTLSGPLPPALGGLSSLETLWLNLNSELSGPLPGTLTRLSSLNELGTHGTGLCAPHDAAFQAWLATIEFTGAACNRAPMPSGAIPAQTFTAGGTARGVSVAEHFRDPDDDPLTYAAASSRGDVVSVHVTGDAVWLAPGASGTATVTVTARDAGGLSAAQALAVTVVESTGALTERAALEALYDATGGAGWTDSTNWKTDAPLGQWYGVWTDDGGRVTGLDLSWNELDGPIPSELGRLSNLERLLLGGNALIGPIPSSLGSLSNLKALGLAWNALSGPIPPAVLGGLSSLEALELADNELSGPIPLSLGNLPNLRTLRLERNELDGPIPPSLGNLSNLTWLGLGDNALSGPIPSSLGNLSKLEWLDLSGKVDDSHRLAGELSGPIPLSLGNLSNLRTLRLEGNELSGPIPSSLGNLSNLRNLSLWKNALSGPIPAWVGRLSSLEDLYLGENELTGPIPSELGRMSNLERLSLDRNELSGPVPSSLAKLSNLRELHLSYNWGLAGPLPAGLRESPLQQLGLWLTQTCAPRDWAPWLVSMDEFYGALCGAGSDVTVDVAVVYTPAAREAAGGVAAMEAVIDLMVAETNEAYSASDVRHRLALVGREEVPYTELDSHVDLDRLADPSDGHMDGAHALRDRTGADLVHLIFDTRDPHLASGIAFLGGAFGLTSYNGGGSIFAHELGHNMGLQHDRYQVHRNEDGASGHPAYGYVNQRAFEAGALSSSRWRTIMSYGSQCEPTWHRGFCTELLRFSNPRQSYDGDPLGVPFGAGGSGVDGPADAAAVLNATGPAVSSWRDRSSGGANGRPEPVGVLPDRSMSLQGTLDVDVSPAFADPDGDALTYGASSAAPDVVTVLAAGARVTLTAVAEGAAAIRVTATDPGGLSATQSFAVTVGASVNGAPFTDDPIVPGVTPVRAVHFRELRARIDALRQTAGLARFAWTDAVLTARATRVRLLHLLELRSALTEAYAAAGRRGPSWTDANPAAAATPIRAVHLTELRAAVRGLE